MTDKPVTVTQAERFYIDCEFDGHGGPLLSFGIVTDNEHEGLHIEVDVSATDPWVITNVVPLMDKHNAPDCIRVAPFAVGSMLRQFIGNCEAPVIVADSPVDIGRFCTAISTNDTGDWASAEYPMMTFEVHNVDCYPTKLEGAVQHNAWWDAMALREKLRHRTAHAQSQPTAPDDYEQYRPALRAMRVAYGNAETDTNILTPMDAVDQDDIRAGIAFAANMPQSQHSDLADRASAAWNDIPDRTAYNDTIYWANEFAEDLITALRQSPQDTVQQSGFTTYGVGQTLYGEPLAYLDVEKQIAIPAEHTDTVRRDALDGVDHSHDPFKHEGYDDDL